MSLWASGDTLDSVTLNAKMASATSSAGFSTNTLNPESGNTVTFTSGNVVLNTGSLSFFTAASQIVLGQTTLSFRNNANTADNLVLNNDGLVFFSQGVIEVGNITNTFIDQAAGTRKARLSANSATKAGRLQLWPDTSGTPWQLDAFGNDLRFFKGGTVVASFTSALQLVLSAATFNLSTSGTPTGTGTGTTGDIKWDNGFVYVCTSTNSWKRATLNTF